MDNTLEFLSNVPPTTHFHYLKGRVFLLEISDGYGNLLHTKHYYHERSNETKIITSFLKGRIRSVEIHQILSPTKKAYKIKQFLDKNITFVGEVKESSAGAFSPGRAFSSWKVEPSAHRKSLSPVNTRSPHYQKDFLFLTNVTYDEMADYDREVITYKHSPTHWEEWVFEPGKPSVLSYLSHNQVERQVTLRQKKFKSHPRADYFSYDNQEWSDYLIRQYDKHDPRYLTEWRYEGALLREMSTLFEGQEGLTQLQTITYRYLPNRTLFNVSRYRQGRLVEEQQSHSPLSP